MTTSNLMENKSLKNSASTGTLSQTLCTALQGESKLKIKVKKASKFKKLTSNVDLRKTIKPEEIMYLQKSYVNEIRSPLTH